MALQNPMQLVDDAGIDELLEIARCGTDGGESHCLKILSELKPYVKHNEPKPVLAGLKVLEEMMRSGPRKFQKCVASEEWMRRLGKIVYNSKEPMLKMTVLQLLGNWEAEFKNDHEMEWLAKKCAELSESGVTVPCPSPEQVRKREVKGSPHKGNFEERIHRLIEESPMNMLDDDGITELCLLVLATDEVGVSSVLKALKPFVKNLKQPKHSLAGLTILDELVKRNKNHLVHKGIATEEWMNRLVKLHNETEDSPVKMKVLQLMVNWREQFKQKQELSAVSRACAQLYAAGVQLPPVLDTTRREGSLGPAQVLSPDGKVIDMSAQEAEPVEPGKPLRTTEAKLAPMYSCHGSDDFGTIHWTLDQLLHGSDEITSIWNPMDAVRGTDPEGFKQKLSDVGIKGPPTSEPTAEVDGDEGDAGMNTVAATRLKQSEQFWKNKATALEKKLQHGGSPVKAKEYKVASTTDGIDLGEKNMELQQLVDQLQEQVRTVQTLQSSSADGATSMITRELNDVQDKNKELQKKLKKTEGEIEALQNEQAAAAGDAGAETKELHNKFRTADSARREAEAEVDDLKAIMEKSKAEAASGNSDAAAVQAELETLQVEFNATQRKFEELELALDMANAEKEQLSNKVNKVAGIKFQQAALRSSSNAKDLKADHTRLRTFASESLAEMSTAITTVESTLVQQLKLSESLVSGALREREELRNLYKVECKKRKKLYNALQELRGNLRVYCRMRPLNARELEDQGGQNFLFINDNADELTINERNAKGVGKRKFEFDQVLGPQSTQEHVYSTVAPLISSVLDGYNVCIFAYGQTGSGKTFTMEGNPEMPGISRRAVTDIFAQLVEREDEEEVSVRLSMLEVYNEEIKDLLDPKKEKKLDRLSVDPLLGIVIDGLAEEPVTSAKEVEDAVARGQGSRSTACTNMNEHSSRSHLILRLYITSTNKTSGDVSHAKLSLVDLAGSERVKKSGAEGKALAEAQGINKSLAALGNVIRSLATNQGHVPYRNSKLTHILQDSIGGDAKTLMFANINPAEMHIPETLCALNFAVQAKSVATGAIKKNVTKAKKKK